MTTRVPPSKSPPATSLARVSASRRHGRSYSGRAERRLTSTFPCRSTGGRVWSSPRTPFPEAGSRSRPSCASRESLETRAKGSSTRSGAARTRPSRENPSASSPREAGGTWWRPSFRPKVLSPATRRSSRATTWPFSMGSSRSHGTGSEDFFNGGWYDVPGRWERRQSLPVSGCLDYKKHLGRTGAYRLFLTDALAYRESINLSNRARPDRERPADGLHCGHVPVLCPSARREWSLCLRSPRAAWSTESSRLFSRLERSHSRIVAFERDVLEEGGESEARACASSR